MSVLHGSWIFDSGNSYLFIWGETWRSAINDTPTASELALHPFSLTNSELFAFLQSRHLDQIGSDRNHQKQGRIEVFLPSQTVDEGKALPILSEQFLSLDLDIESLLLSSWQVEGLYLDALAAVEFLQALPLSSFQNDDYVGSDLRFWSQVYRWSLDLLARGKFLPGIAQQSNEIQGYWQPLLDSTVDQARLAKFIQQMPLACRAYQNNKQFAEPQKLLLEFLTSILDAQLRNWIDAGTLPPKASLVQQWLQTLSQASAIPAQAAEIERIQTAMQNWTLPVQDYLARGDRRLGQNLFRVCLSLVPPTEGEINWGYSDWKLKYYLQALDDLEFLVEAETVWQHPTQQLVIEGRTIDQPQETLLKGLGLASRLYSPIQESLQEKLPTQCQLNPIQVYEFIRASAWQLQDHGLGVKLPPGLASGAGEKRLGVSISAQVKPKKGERLGLQSLLKYDLKLAVGDRTISQADFERLLAQKSPLVEIDGEWIALQPADVRAAQEVLQQSNNQQLSVEDALRLSTGNTEVIAKLPVVNFEAKGVLQELISNLNNNQAVEPLETPADFRGELRPYQARGVGWLAFLERWGLGACLADDMGLGKCVSKDTEIFLNGNLATAQEIWQHYAGKTEFDGEGFWAEPTAKLLVNSVEATGKIVQASVRRLYRQQVREKLRKITLNDGSSITITQRHQLLTSNGWTNTLQVGDYVCVPATLHWQGKPEDPDLVKFVAWQIAEGYESGDYGRLSIAQKDPRILEDLYQTFSALGDRYGFRINRPRVCCYAKKTPELKINSQAYRQFLEAKGYQWGRRSADKMIPPWVMEADLESLRIFLSNYFDAEGSVISRMRSIEISTASAILIEQLSTLLRRFGIWLRIAAKQKCATNGTGTLRTYYIGTLGGNSARRFNQEIGFNHQEKQQKLEQICQRQSNTNIEGIPASEIVAEAIATTKLPVRHLKMHNTVYINGSQEFSRFSLEKVVQGIEQVLSGVAEQEYRLKKTSRWTNKTLQAYADLDKQQLETTQKRLQILLNREVFYCQIQAIETVDYNGWVYDFEIDKHHNFVANNILCHNTIQTIAFLLNIKEQDTLTKPTLLVCPTSVLNNWEREVKKFAPTLSTIVHHGDKRSKGKTFVKEAKNKDLVITSYPIVFRDEKTLAGVDWQVVVLDEAQNVKNPQAKQSQAVRKLKAEFRVALTGTPVENRLSELWSILDFLNPGFLGTQQFFQRRFAVPIEKYGDRNSLATLRSLVQPFILRRLKTDRDIIQDLPEKQEMNVFCGLSAEQAQLYQQLVDQSLAKIEEAQGIQRRGEILTLLMKLKQICNHPAQYLKEKGLGSGNRSGKLLRLEEMLEEVVEEGDRALIFTQFSEWGKLLKPYLETELGREVLFLYGATRRPQRQEMIDRFQNDPNGPPIFILSLKAGGTGLNLTRANHVFHVDRWWNPAVEDQASDRAFRIGQKRNVQVHKFVCSGTLEERISETLESKKQLAEQTVDAGEQWLTEMDTDQLRNLLLLDRDAVIDEES